MSNGLTQRFHSKINTEAKRSIKRLKNYAEKITWKPKKKQYYTFYLCREWGSQTALESIENQWPSGK